MPKAYAFDAYGTLFDVSAAMMRHADALGPNAAAMAALWRVKQLEYSWTRTLMGRYADFWALTQAALDFVVARHPEIDAGCGRNCSTPTGSSTLTPMPRRRSVNSRRPESGR